MKSLEFNQFPMRRSCAQWIDRPGTRSTNFISRAGLSMTPSMKLFTRVLYFRRWAEQLLNLFLSTLAKAGSREVAQARARQTQGENPTVGSADRHSSSQLLGQLVIKGGKKNLCMDFNTQHKKIVSFFIIAAWHDRTAPPAVESMLPLNTAPHLLDTPRSESRGMPWGVSFWTAPDIYSHRRHLQCVR